MRFKLKLLLQNDLQHSLTFEAKLWRPNMSWYKFAFAKEFGMLPTEAAFIMVYEYHQLLCKIFHFLTIKPNAIKTVKHFSEIKISTNYDHIYINAVIRQYAYRYYVL